MWAVEAGAVPCPGTSTLSGSFKDSETTKAGKKSSPLSHIYYLGIITHWEVLAFLIGRNTIITKITYTEPF